MFLDRILYVAQMPGEQFIQLLIEYGLAGMGWFLLATGVAFLSASLIGRLLDRRIKTEQARNLGGLLLLIGIGTFMLGLIVSPLSGDLKKYCVTNVPLNDPEGLVVHSQLDLTKKTEMGGFAPNARNIIVLGKCENFRGKVWCFVKGKDKADGKTLKGWINAEDYLAEQEVCKKI